MESTAKVHIRPHVLHSIIDSYERRSENTARVVGSLLGNVEKDVIEVTNSYIVPHDERDNRVSMDLEFGNSMFRLMKYIHPNEQIVGWYSTGNEVTEQNQIVHQDVYMQLVERGKPVFILVDTNLKSGDGKSIDIKAFISKQVGVPRRTKGTVFLPVPVSIEALEGERCAVRLMQQSLYDNKRIVQIHDDYEHIHHLTQELLGMLEKVLEYVNSAIEEGIVPDHTVGKMLAEVVHAIPTVDPEKWPNMLDNDANHNLMISYLASLLRTQLGTKEAITNTI